MPNLNTVQQDIAELTPEAQQIIFTLIDLLKKNSLNLSLKQKATIKNLSKVA